MPEFNPGEFVFLKGNVLSQFYKVRSGRFAILQSDRPFEGNPPRISPDAQILGILEHPADIFGEVDALLSTPQTISVVALTPSEADSISIRPPSEFEQVIAVSPSMGIRVATSFAKRLKASLDLYSELLHNRLQVEELIQKSCRCYLSNLVALEALPRARHEDWSATVCLAQARQHDLFNLAQKIDETTYLPPGSSINNCIVRPPTSADRVSEFPTGTCICRRGTLGNRLFILIDGAVDVLLGPTTRIRLEEPGTVIGEIAALLNLDAPVPDFRRTADVVTATPVKALVLGLEEIEPFLHRHPETATRMVKAIIERTRVTTHLIAEQHRELHNRLFKCLSTCLEGHHTLAKSLQPVANEVWAGQLFKAAAAHSRLIYNRFLAFKQVITTERLGTISLPTISENKRTH